MKRRHALATVAVCASLAGCGVQPTAPIFAGVAPGKLASAGPYVYFIVAGVLRPLTVYASAQRNEPPPEGTATASAAPPAAEPSSGPTPDLLSIALARLAQGPTTQQRAGGIRTDLPSGLRIGIRSRSARSVTLMLTSPTDRFGKDGLAQIACTVTRATATLGSGEKQIPPWWQFPDEITVVTPDGKRHAAPRCGKYLNAPPFAP